LQINISAQDSSDNLTTTVVSGPLPVAGFFLAHSMTPWKTSPAIQPTSFHISMEYNIMRCKSCRKDFHYLYILRAYI